MPIHCSANIGKNEDSALFFGLSGTGKTTLSTDPNRRLVGDDEHGWSDNGIFNFEGGCYAKTINLDPSKEPDIFNAIKPGALLENVITDENGVIDYGDGTITENTRVSYPINYIKNIEKSNLMYSKFIDELIEEKYTMRWVGTMVADCHRTLLKGGFFSYPADNKNIEGIIVGKAIYDGDIKLDELARELDWIMVAKISTIKRKIKNGDKLGFSERARAVNKGLLPSKVKKRKNVKK